MGFENWVPQIKGAVEVLANINSSPYFPMATPSLLCSFMAPAPEVTNAAAIIVPDNEKLLLAKEEQAQRDADNLRQVLEDM